MLFDLTLQDIAVYDGNRQVGNLTDMHFLPAIWQIVAIEMRCEDGTDRTVVSDAVKDVLTIPVELERIELRFSPMTHQQQNSTSKTLAVSQLIGKTVECEDGPLGAVIDVNVDCEAGRLSSLICKVGGILAEDLAELDTTRVRMADGQSLRMPGTVEDAKKHAPRWPDYE